MLVVLSPISICNNDGAISIIEHVPSGTWKTGDINKHSVQVTGKYHAHCKKSLNGILLRACYTSGLRQWWWLNVAGTARACSCHHQIELFLSWGDSSLAASVMGSSWTKSTSSTQMINKCLQISRMTPTFPLKYRSANKVAGCHFLNSSIKTQTDKTIGKISGIHVVFNFPFWCSLPRLMGCVAPFLCDVIYDVTC